MNRTIEKILPGEIEKRSFELITRELGERVFLPGQEPVIKRVIHATADFEYADSLKFSRHALESAQNAIASGATVVTDTQMGKAGIHKKTLERFGGRLMCFMTDEDVARAAKAQGTTRAAASMDKAAQLEGKLIFAIGNAPTALIRLYELIMEGKLSPALVIGVPVGFVNVVQSKELILGTETPYIVAKGRKGGSSVAAAIVNALLYMLDNNRD